MTKSTIRERARAEIFRITRIVDKYSRDEMAKITGISKSTIVKIENRIIQITPKAVEKYLKAFNLKFSEFEKAEDEIVKILMDENKKLRHVAYIVIKMLKHHYASECGSTKLIGYIDFDGVFDCIKSFSNNAQSNLNTIISYMKTHL